MLQKKQTCHLTSRLGLQVRGDDSCGQIVLTPGSRDLGQHDSSEVARLRFKPVRASAFWPGGEQSSNGRLCTAANLLSLRQWSCPAAA